jgi:RimJ/RimL family protein N-acetyltransferase
LNNPASCAVAAGAGFLSEGIERQRLAFDGTRYDVERHARLVTDPLTPPQRPVRITD